MKNFSFRLERLLRLREEAEQRQAMALGEATRAEVSADQLCEEREDHLRGVHDRVTPVAGQLTSAGMLRTLQLASAAAAGQVEAAEQAREAARAQADQERDRLIAAQRDRKTLERLREHQKAAWQGAVARHEQQTMDEIAGRTRGPAAR
ncbi:MAG: flagellar export protein FliJ [Gemmatimonadales bacterium]